MNSEEVISFLNLVDSIQRKFVDSLVDSRRDPAFGIRRSRSAAEVAVQSHSNPNASIQD
jgi:hypothetical protein